MIGDEENPGSPAATPAPQVQTPAAPQPAPVVSETGGGSEAHAPAASPDALPANDLPRTLQLADDPHRRRRRRRRRRHGPRPEGAGPEAGASVAATESALAAAAAEGATRAIPPAPRRLRVEAIASGGEFILAALPASDRPRRRRRRRRGARAEGAATPGGENAVASPGEGGPQQQQRRERGPRQRGRADQRRGDRRDGDRQRGDGARLDDRNRDAQNPGERREGQSRDGERDRERGPRRAKGGKPFGKGGDRDGGGRDGRRDKPAPKLYSFESVVDRGFEDVAPPPPAEGEAPAESGTRRIDWTIVKRTVADQRAAKTVSAQYILKRDGTETEFPNLGAARAAVNKTIVHPEKLTRPKTDYPSTKK
jgi:hypothetical protein